MNHLQLVTSCLVLLTCARWGVSTAPTYSSTTGAPDWARLSHCPNLRGEVVACGHGQFCSNDPLEKGCRDCTENDFYLKWCRQDPAQLRSKFPTCEIFCEREQWRREVEQNKQQRDDDYQTLLFATLAAVLVLLTLFVAAVFWAVYNRQRFLELEAHRHTVRGTADVRSCRGCGCWPRRGRLPAVRSAAPDTDGESNDSLVKEAAALA